MNTRFKGFVLVLCVMLLSAAASPAWGQTLKLEKSVFAPGEEIRVQFSAPNGYADNAWVGIIPSHVPHGSEATNDQHDITYQYLQKRTSGTLIFTAPNENGAYDFRMHDTDNNGKEVASVGFRVGTDSGGQSLSLEKTVFSPGETIRVSFNAPAGLPRNAWIGLIPSNTPHGSEAVNDQHDVAYQYLENKSSGVFVFTAPDKPGAWDFRLNSSDNNGQELASVSFNVGGGDYVLQLDKTDFKTGEKIRVHFSVVGKLPDNAWIGLIPSRIPHGSEAENDQHDVAYQYLSGRVSGTLVFDAPESGAWDLRLNSSDSDGQELASVSFTVR